MAGYLTDFANNKVLDLLFGAVTLTAPSNLYFGLSKAAATKSGTVAEPSGGGYARAAIGNNAAHFPAASLGTKSNALPISFSAPTADWGPIVSVFVADATTGGNVLAIADLPVPKTIVAGGAAPSIAAGALFLSHT